MLNLRVITPTATLCDCKVEKISLPGALSPFTILENHAPIVSLLQKGKVSYTTEDGAEHTLSISSGFVKMESNRAELCVELPHEK